MKPIKISIFGADGYTCQMPRIKEAMQNLGNILSKDSPELIYSNDPTGYEKAMCLKKKFPSSFLIFNFLDVPWHMPNVDKQTKLLVEHFLAKSDAVTAISYKVKKDLAKFLDKKIEVIYNPIKDVFYDESIKKNNTFLYVGRANDPIKRIDLVKESFLKIKNSVKEIKICGSENPGFGNYLGVISDIELNKLYKKKFIPAWYEKALLFFNGVDDTSRDVDKAIDDFRKVAVSSIADNKYAKKEIIDSRKRLALIYKDGLSEKDPEEALRMIKRAC